MGNYLRKREIESQYYIRSTNMKIDTDGML